MPHPRLSLLYDATTLSDFRRLVQGPIAFVPTMGALHEGHAALIRTAQQKASCVIVSIFVNPKQFGPNEDLAHYPRSLEQDITLTAQAGADALFMPGSDVMYPAGFSTKISLKKLSSVLCGRIRPGHFDGVALVMMKLLWLVRPDFLIMGEKDFQQCRIIQQMLIDCHIPCRFIMAPVIRASDGLALSSRNAYLGPRERALAPTLYQTLKKAAHALKAGADWPRLQEECTITLAKAGFTPLDYFELINPASLSSLSSPTPEARLCVAVHLGKTRLIDTMPLAQAGKN